VATTQLALAADLAFERFYAAQSIASRARGTGQAAASSPPGSSDRPFCCFGRPQTARRTVDWPEPSRPDDA
jgi:hypothetical protein